MSHLHPTSPPHIPNAVTLAFLVSAYFRSVPAESRSEIAAAEWLVNTEMVAEGTPEDTYTVTSKGRAYVEYVLALPIPVSVTRWHMPAVSTDLPI
jgi:uncharacterized protein YqjF (DUF2071 family)